MHYDNNMMIEGSFMTYFVLLLHSTGRPLIIYRFWTIQITKLNKREVKERKKTRNNTLNK